jgi:hypothetical protein
MTIDLPLSYDRRIELGLLSAVSLLPPRSRQTSSLPAVGSDLRICALVHAPRHTLLSLVVCQLRSSNLSNLITLVICPSSKSKVRRPHFARRPIHISAVRYERLFSLPVILSTKSTTLYIHHASPRQHYRHGRISGVNDAAAIDHRESFQSTGTVQGI